VVGVVQDHKVHGVAEEPEPYVYLAAAQSPQLIAGEAHLVARASGDAGAALEVVRDRLRAFDPGLPVQDARRVEAQLARVLMPQRFGGLLLGLLAAVTLAVSAIGVYGMVTFGVRRRTREIGIRLALGASPRRIVSATVAVAAAAVAAGIGAGLALAGALARFVEEYLYGVAPLDPPSFVGGGAVLACAALLAALLPARRAVRVDPRTAMGDDG
jgi:predicted lysophospholipase L1 biosynthesis ABC-type transport system permease subunit